MTTWPLKDDESAKSWGTPHLRVNGPVSPPQSTWGTLPTTVSSNSSLIIDHKTSWSSPNNVTVGSPQGWATNAYPPIYPSPSSAMGNSPSVGPYYGGMWLQFFFISSFGNQLTGHVVDNPFRIFFPTILSVFKSYLDSIESVARFALSAMHRI